MKKIILFLFVIVSAYACKENERPVYDEGNKIYFPGLTTKMDSLVLTLVGRDNGAPYEIPVKVVGMTPSVDQTFKAEVVAARTTAKEGVHYKALDQKFTFKAGNVLGGLPIVFYNTDEALKTAPVVLTLRLIESDDLELGYTWMREVRVIFSMMMRQPISTGYYGDAQSFVRMFGVYSRAKHELLISDKIMGHDLYDASKLPYGVYANNTLDNNSDYFSRYSRVLQKYIIENEVIDENGNRLMPWM